MRTLSFFRVAIISLLLSLVSCQKESDIDLSIGDLVGTWETEEFEDYPYYGPMELEFFGHYVMVLNYGEIQSNGSPIGVIENCEFTIDGNKINYHSYHGYTSTIVVEEFTGPTMRLKISNQYMNVTLNAKKIK